MEAVVEEERIGTITSETPKEDVQQKEEVKKIEVVEESPREVVP